jgi:hypothetical protein
VRLGCCSLGGAGAWALITSAFGIGAVAGGIVVLRMTARHPLKIACVGFGFFALGNGEPAPQIQQQMVHGIGES